MLQRKLKNARLTTLMLAGTMFAALGSAYAADTIETVVVTGSRIPMNNLTNPSPVSVKDAAAIEMTAAYSLEDVLKTMTGTDGSGLQNNSNNGGVGLSTISVRGLGAPRTLVLIDGQRLVPIFVGSTSTPDLNSVPISMIDRVEVLRDGASSVYGADAVGGVVNLITKKDFEGLQLNVDGGTSQHGGGDQYSFSGTLGVNTDRANVTINATYQAEGAIGQWQRDWSKALTVHGIRGSILRSQLPTLQDSNSSITWIDGTAYDFSDPATAGLVPCTNYVGGRIRLNASCDTPEGGWNTLQGSLDRTQISINGHYDITNNVTFILQGSFTDRRSGQQLRPEPLLGDSIFSYNENTGTILYPGFYVPADPRWGYTGLAVTGAASPLPAGNQACPDKTPGATCFDTYATPILFGPRTYRQTSDTYRIRAGLEGNLFTDYHWEIGYVQQRNEDTNRIFNTGDFYHLAEAVGQIPCVDVPGGCVYDPGFGYDIPKAPPNFYNIDNLTPEQVAYLKYTDTDTNKSIENYAYADLHGPVFDLPWSGGGTVQAAVGVERRWEHLEDHPDKQVILGYGPGRTEPTGGGYGVYGVYAELQIPLLKDEFLAKSLDLSTSGRYDHYSTFGDATTYKLAANWSVTDDIRFRASYSTGFRAPSTAELFGGNAVSFNTVSGDPCDSRTVINNNANMPNTPAEAAARLAPGTQCFAALSAAGLTPAQIAVYQSPENNLTTDQRPLLLGGNPNLSPEKSHGWTVGTVVTPTFMPGFSAGVDYYETTVTNAIQGGGGVPGAIGLDTFVLECYAVPPGPQSAFACSQIRHGVNGIQIINGQNANLGFNKVSGLELQLNFDTAAADLDLPIPGSFVINLEGTREFQNILVIPNPGGFTVNYTGTYNLGNEVNDPGYRANASIDWNMDEWSVHWDTLYASSTRDLFGAPKVFGTMLADNWNSNLSFAYALGEIFPDWGTKNNTRIIVGINNIFDANPPFLRNDSICKCNSMAGAGYDFVGRFFYTRLQIKM